MVKKAYRVSIVSSIILFLFGLMLVLDAESFIKSVTTLLGIILIVIGVFPIIDYFRYRKSGLLASIGFISGIFSLVCGLMFLLNDEMLMVLVPLFVGVWMIINGINKAQISFELKDSDESSWVITFVYSVIIIILGAYFIINPMSGAKVVTNTLGIIICIYATFDIIDCILIKVKYKSTIKEISKVIDEQ